MSFVAVIDYGMGNLHSIEKALQRADPAAEIVVTSDPERIRLSERVVFPGVGAIRDCMIALERRGLEPVLREAASSFSARQADLTASLSYRLDTNLKLQGYVLKGFSDGSPDRGIGVHVVWNF